jgi:GT2 family glycosyltransferase
MRLNSATHERKVDRAPAACTIISRNYLSHARVLASSYLIHHPGARFFLLSVDGLPEGEIAGPGIEVIGTEELELPYLRELCFKYDITELCTALKPSLLRLLLDRYAEGAIVYFDPDILIMRPLDELIDSLATSKIVLTPHLLEPIPIDGLKPSEQDILQAGAYNLGFIAVTTSAETTEFLQWWEERLREGCFIQFSEGLMTDQKWIDLVPSLFPATILKDDTYNVAYWNVHSRTIERAAESFTVRDRPIAFFHFSGFDPAHPEIFSKHQTRTRVECGTPLAELLEHYIRLQDKNGFWRSRQWGYGFGALSDGSAISMPLRRTYAKLRSSNRGRFGDPFCADGPQSFFTWATAANRSTNGLSPFLDTIYNLRPDVMGVFPDIRNVDRDGFLAWASTAGASEYHYDPHQMRVACVTSELTAPKASLKKCSVIIPVYNLASLTRVCLDHVLSSAAQTLDYEVIVCDDSSTDSTRELLSVYGSRIRVLSHEANKGFAASCNDAALEANGEYLVFLNNDTEGQTGWLDALVRYAEGHPEAAIVGCKLLFPNDTIQHAGFVIGEDKEPRHVYTGFPSEHPAVNHSGRTRAVTGACLLIRKSEFEENHGFDTAFRNGFEDVDLCLRLGELGRETHYCHESVLYHLESVTRDPRTSHAENRELFRKRWAERLQPDEFQRYVQDGLLKINYSPLYPIAVSFSPLLATAQLDDHLNADRLLKTRARQVLGLLKDNIQLTVRLREAESDAVSATAASPARVSPASMALPVVLCRGQRLWLSAASRNRLVSLIVPVKNGASRLRELLPAILAQRIQDQIEIIAIDSGSRDGSVDLLKDFGATVISIPAHSFNHGLTRTVATEYAHGSIFVFLNQSTLPADERWLANLVRPLDVDPHLAGVCSRVLPRKDADILTARDVLRNINAAANRVVTQVTDWPAYRAMKGEALRAFVNFHTLSAAIRATVFRELPFRAAEFAEDLIWGKEALERGYKLQFEPSSVALHSHNYSLLDILRRNFDDGLACRSIIGRRLAGADVEGHIDHHVRDDWQYLASTGLSPADCGEWQRRSAQRRTAQVLGQWLGLNCEEDARLLLSLTEQIKSGSATEFAENRGIYNACSAG